MKCSLYTIRKLPVHLHPLLGLVDCTPGHCSLYNKVKGIQRAFSTHKTKVILGCYLQKRKKNHLGHSEIRDWGGQTQPAEKVNFRLDILKCKGKSHLCCGPSVVGGCGERAQSFHPSPWIENKGKKGETQLSKNMAYPSLLYSKINAKAIPKIAFIIIPSYNHILYIVCLMYSISLFFYIYIYIHF